MTVVPCPAELFLKWKNVFLNQSQAGRVMCQIIAEVFKRSKRTTFRCKIVILGGIEIVNREVDRCKNAMEKISRVTVLAFLLLVQIRNEKIRRLIGLFCNILKTVRKHQHSCLNTRKQFKQHSFQVFGVFDICKLCERA